MKKVFLVSLILAASFAFTEEHIPLIKKISISDIYFKQLYFDIQSSYKAKHNNSPPPRMHIYRYITRDTDDFYRVSAAFSIPVQTLATLNGFSNPGALRKGQEVLICNRQGLFIPAEKGGGRFMQYIRHSRHRDLKNYPALKIRGKRYYFIENENFTPTEYAFFLKILYRFPLNDAILTSDFGERDHPITHTPSWHRGIDLAAPEGTDVFSANSGVITDTGYSTIYGNYVLIKHDSGYETFYAHLKSIDCTRGHELEAGVVIGTVGTTGQSTGPHLHFEIRKDGQALNPDHFLSK